LYIDPSGHEGITFAGDWSETEKAYAAKAIAMALALLGDRAYDLLGLDVGLTLLMDGLE
jgi:hypothetical protein